MNELLAILFAFSLIIWVGGAITGQIWMFRAGVRSDAALRGLLIPQINWIIRYIYIPMAATAFISGALLAWCNSVPFTTSWLLFPIAVFLATVVIGSFYSLPEYAHLVQLLHQRDPRDTELQHRIEIAAWVNRIELLLVLIGLIGIIVQPQF